MRFRDNPIFRKLFGGSQKKFGDYHRCARCRRRYLGGKAGTTPLYCSEVCAQVGVKEHAIESRQQRRHVLRQKAKAELTNKFRQGQYSLTVPRRHLRKMILNRARLLDRARQNVAAAAAAG